MGGIQGGERASKLAVEMLANAFHEHPPENVPAFFETIAQKADQAVHDLTGEDGQRLEAGTTIVAAICNAEGLCWLSIGDSRLYLYRNGSMICPVKAHNYRLLLDRLLEAGRISEKGYQAELPKGDALISYLGIGNLSRMEMNLVPFQPQAGDRILLCSDGLYRNVTEAFLLEKLQDKESTLEDIILGLVAEAESNAENMDNTSIILISA